MTSQPKAPGNRKRLDDILVERGLAPSKAVAKALIMAGKVRSEDRVLDKPGKAQLGDIPLTVEQPPRFVSRGGEKMQASLEAFGLSPKGLSVLDVGLSTGGFSDCLLQAGAGEITGIDVGRAQLHPKLGNDPRLTSIEKCNARHLQPGDLPREYYDWLVIDVSFISLRTVLPAVWPFLASPGQAVLLIKPQFEAEREEVARSRGVIREEAIRQRIRSEFEDFFARQLPGVGAYEIIDCPVHGGDGNQEFLAHVVKDR
ncbi:MAG: TlyA family RNA methyltransferase [Opitutales bacterium]|nr:TlyA family RNA methyltransferase [Opitutales bacterium]MCH8540929.1 TlyA family RNA methyltransferase [Opitutales bacterium]